MTRRHVFFLSIPGLRTRDVNSEATPTLHTWASAGTMVELTPTFPCVTSPVQASMFTGAPPDQHGVIANGFYDRTRREVEFWVGRNDKIAGRQIWEDVHQLGLTSAVWHAQNIKDAAADFIVTPAPVHEADGTTRLWCYSKPEQLYPRLLEALGHFPLQHYWGPLSNIESSRWILRGAKWLHDHHAPNFQFVYLPHLDYAMQKFGPQSPQTQQSLRELDAEIAQFLDEIATSGDIEPVFVAAGEYAMTPVTGAVYPNRILRQLRLLTVKNVDGGELIDLDSSKAFAMVDHQLAHVFVQSEAQKRQATIERVVDAFRREAGVAAVYFGENRIAIGLDHPRSGDVILISTDDRWFAYSWWLDDELAPTFARTVDIHRKPGYDPVELFFDPKTRGIPLDAGLVRGSHGVPVSKPEHRTAFLCSRKLAVSGALRDTDLKEISLTLLRSKGP